MIRQALLVVLITWCLAVASVFVLSAIVPRWPVWLELPWSDFEDFVVTPNGEVVVYTGSFQRLLVYDLEGRFVASLPGPRARGDHRLAVDRQGRVYVRRGRTVWVTDTLDPEAYTPRMSIEKAPEDGTWVLDTKGDLQAVEGPAPGPVPNRAIGPGELLFAPGMERRRSFALDTGGQTGRRVDRRGDHLLIESAGGEATVVGTPWYLYPFKFPFPGALAWVSAFVLGSWKPRSNTKR